MVRLLSTMGIVMVAKGVAWGLLFAWQGERPLALIELLLGLLGLAVMESVRQRRMRAAALLAFGGLFVLVCLFSLFLDVPTAAVPRSSHVFLLVLAVCAYYVFLNAAPLLRHGTVALFLLAFVAFAAGPFGLPGEYAIPDTIRRPGVWANLLAAAGCLLLVLRLVESDFTERRALHRALRDALVARRFELHHQPQLDARGRVVGAEALLRWRDARRGLVAPTEFIQAAEETGLILPLGQWVLSTACRQLAEWQRHPVTRHLRLSVNVSAVQVRQPDFAAQVLEAVARAGAVPQRLTLELTESVLLHDLDDSAAKLHALHAAGIRLALDDFGTGYSSLAYLRQLPIDELKIDRAFVREVEKEPQAATITRTLLQLGRDLGLEVIAEGVENAAQHALLRGQGCRLFQGFLFGEPLDADAFARRLDPSPAPDSADATSAA